jgi:hypothetical protein
MKMAKECPMQLKIERDEIKMIIPNSSCYRRSGSKNILTLEKMKACP